VGKVRAVVAVSAARGAASETAHGLVFDSDHAFYDAQIYSFAGFAGRGLGAKNLAHSQDAARQRARGIVINHDLGLHPGCDLVDEALVQISSHDARGIGREEKKRGDIECADAVTRARGAFNDAPIQWGADGAAFELMLIGVSAGGRGDESGLGRPKFCVQLRGEIKRLIDLDGGHGFAFAECAQAGGLALGSGEPHAERLQRGAGFGLHGHRDGEGESRGPIINDGEQLSGVHPLAFLDMHGLHQTIVAGGEADEAALNIHSPARMGGGGFDDRGVDCLLGGRRTAGEKREREEGRRT
jgi:hypothetical protein